MNLKHKLLENALVIIQLLAIILCCFPVGLISRGFAIGLLLSAIGFASGIMTLYFNRLGNFSIYPELKPNALLITNGPYKYIRHPMYASLFIMMLGITIYNFYYLNFIGLIILMPTLVAKAHIEEDLLKKHFPTYIDYMKNTKRFIPFIY